MAKRAAHDVLEDVQSAGCHPLDPGGDGSAEEGRGRIAFEGLGIAGQPATGDRRVVVGPEKGIAAGGVERPVACPRQPGGGFDNDAQRQAFAIAVRHPGRFVARSVVDDEEFPFEFRRNVEAAEAVHQAGEAIGTVPGTDDDG